MHRLFVVYLVGHLRDCYVLGVNNVWLLSARFAMPQVARKCTQSEDSQQRDQNSHSNDANTRHHRASEISRDYFEL